VTVGRVVIVGAGPAGAALAYLLARRGVRVALLERHPDFERTFRGDGLQPSGMDAFDQMATIRHHLAVERRCPAIRLVGP
jgi:2-polyprenyl-6-methoxyphenol hydroxylase-like FAD-dependent oxidoreductase